MTDDMAEFIRRAAQKRQQRQQQSERAPTGMPTHSHQLSSHQPQSEEIAYIEEVFEAEPVHEPPATNAVSRKFDERASHMGERISSQHRDEGHAHIEHQDGGLGELEEFSYDEKEKEAEPKFSAADIAKMAKNSLDVRRALILGEILQRPEW